MLRLLRALWAGWKVVAHAIGNFQAKLLLSLFYFIVMPPFAMIVKLFKDPLQLRRSGRASGWVERAEPAPSNPTRQF